MNLNVLFDFAEFHVIVTITIFAFFRNPFAAPDFKIIPVAALASIPVCQARAQSLGALLSNANSILRIAIPSAIISITFLAFCPWAASADHRHAVDLVDLGITPPSAFPIINVEIVTFNIISTLRHLFSAVLSFFCFFCCSVISDFKVSVKLNLSS